MARTILIIHISILWLNDRFIVVMVEEVLHRRVSWRWTLKAIQKWEAVNNFCMPWVKLVVIL
jgi:hypothetical protein